MNIHVATIMGFIALLIAVMTRKLVKDDKLDVALSIDRACRVIFPVVFSLAFVVVVIW